MVTPNIPELAALGGEEAVLAHGCHLLAKGGHAEAIMSSTGCSGPNGEIRRLEGKRIETDDTHGTGCTLASAIATGLGKGFGIEKAFEQAVSFVRIAILEAPGLGQGQRAAGPAICDRLPVGRAGQRLGRSSARTRGLAMLVDQDRIAVRIGDREAGPGRWRW